MGVRVDMSVRRHFRSQTNNGRTDHGIFQLADSGRRKIRVMHHGHRKKNHSRSPLTPHSSSRSIAPESRKEGTDNYRLFLHNTTDQQMRDGFPHRSSRKQDQEPPQPAAMAPAVDASSMKSRPIPQSSNISHSPLSAATRATGNGQGVRLKRGAGRWRMAPLSSRIYRSRMCSSSMASDKLNTGEKQISCCSSTLHQ